MPRPATEALVSITRLAESLGVNRMYLSGFVDGMGVQTVRGEQNSKAIEARHIPAIRHAIERLTAVKRG
jgi:hypothetical protein